MSHIATIKTQLKDLEAIKLAAAELGFTFHENQTTCIYYAGQTVPCNHVLTHSPGFYEGQVGLVKQPDGSYSIVTDEMNLGKVSAQLCQKYFKRDTNPLANNFGGFTQLYGVHKTQIEAQKRGWLTKRVQVGGKIQVHVTGM